MLWAINPGQVMYVKGDVAGIRYETSAGGHQHGNVVAVGLASASKLC